MDERVEEQVRLALDAIRTARAQPGGVDHQALAGLARQIQGAAPEATLASRRAFVNAVGERLKAEAGPSEERKLKGLAGKHRVFDDPDMQTVHDFGTMLTIMAKGR